jgi:hypothetical protein
LLRTWNSGPPARTKVRHGDETLNVVWPVSVHLATTDKSRYPERMRQLVYDLVLLVIAVWLLLSGPLAAQSRNELRQKYGKPVSETFVARPDMSVTATFGTSGRITEFLISPKNTDLIKSRGKTLSVDS